MWDERDPMPPGLIDKVLVAIATENLEEEYELLHLVERSRELGVRRGRRHRRRRPTIRSVRGWTRSRSFSA